MLGKARPNSPSADMVDRLIYQPRYAEHKGHFDALVVHILQGPERTRRMPLVSLSFALMDSADPNTAGIHTREAFAAAACIVDAFCLGSPVLDRLLPQPRSFSCVYVSGVGCCFVVYCFPRCLIYSTDRAGSAGRAG